MTRYHRDPFLADIFEDDGEMEAALCIDVVPGGVMEDIPATWRIDFGNAKLRSFKIGDLTGDRAMAVLMTGEAHVADQERAVSERWAEGASERRESRYFDTHGDRRDD